jgi:hypothetical protein
VVLEKDEEDQLDGSRLTEEYYKQYRKRGISYEQYKKEV